MINPELNPWKILEEKHVYANPWIQLSEFDVINPSGGKGIYGKVHFKNIAIGVFVLDDQNNTYLVGQFRFPINRYSWEIPEGGGPLDSDPLVNAKRELLEETGLVANKWTPLLQMHLSNSVSDELAIVYLAKELTQFEAEPEETEQLLVQKIAFEKVFEMAEQGIITDSISVASIYKIKLMMLQGKI